MDDLGHGNIRKNPEEKRNPGRKLVLLARNIVAWVSVGQCTRADSVRVGDAIWLSWTEQLV